MTAKTTAAPYVSGFCGTGGHDRCQGVYAGVVCACPHHTEPEPEPVALHHCPTCTCTTVASPASPVTITVRGLVTTT